MALIFVNRSAAPVTVNCTFVDGYVSELGGSVYPDYYPGSDTINAGGVGFISWDATNYQLTQFSHYANFSCNLPVGVEINILSASYTSV